MADIAIHNSFSEKVEAIRLGVPLPEGTGSVLTMTLAYAGHVAFFSFCGEMERPQDFPKSLAFMQTCACVFYILIAAIIYSYAGPGVASPAIGSARPIVQKVCWGIAMPTIVIAGVVNGAVACKYLYLRLWKGTDVFHKRNFKAYSSWCAICAGLWTIAWVIAEAIPNFNMLLGVIVSLAFFNSVHPLPLLLFFSAPVFFC
jgi:hypothetical protein